jgi:aspartyl-tRNA(Asn)/glutamyl-tRNA(Gln) amidotransferase subunit A
MPHDNLPFATIAELQKLLRAKKISAVELAKFFLARLEKIGPTYNALAELTPTLALSQARKADKQIGSGELTSPLLGIPYGAKDLLATKGIPTRWGSPPHRDQLLDYDATVVKRLREVGAVLLGKLAMVEIAGGGGYVYPSASLHGPGLNPWNVNHWSGGSSSGSGSAVAAGLAPYALGSETWGSIVTPSAYCGITGLRPTWGLVSRYGAMELAWSMDKVGPMAHTAEDCGYVLQAIAGADEHDFTTRNSKGFVFKPRAAQKSFRVGVLPADFSDEPLIEKAFEEALRSLRKAGIKLSSVELPQQPYDEVARALLNGEMAAAHEEFVKSGKVDELVDKGQIEGLKASLNGSVAAYARAAQQRPQLTYEVRKLFQRFDALVSPSLVIEAVTLDTNLRTAFRRRGGYAVLGALCGLPALTVPMGFGRQGLPLGLTFTGDLFAEHNILELGMRYQRETDWHTRKPPMA